MKGKIVLTESYGKSQRIFYVKSNEKGIITTHHENVSYNLKDWFMKIFLPQGYPNSVSTDYISYQIWDTAQAFCSTITGTFAMQEVLRGVGVGSADASPLAATITWVIKDGCGHLGRIFFAYGYGTHLDVHSKMWRLYADILNDGAMCLEMALPYFESSTRLILCFSTVIKAIVGIAGGATRAALTQHHALRGNMADVAAKDSAQETAVNLVASFTALAIVSVFGCSFPLFMLMMSLHILFNYLAVRSVCLKTLNDNRFLEVIKSYLNKEEIPGPKIVNALEPIIVSPMSNESVARFCGFYIKLGASIETVANLYPSAIDLNSLNETFMNQNYLLYPCVPKRTVYVLLKEGACVDDILCAYFHAVLYSILICAINKETLPCFPLERSGPLRAFAAVYQRVQEAEWSRDTVSLLPYTSNALICGPSTDLAMYVNGFITIQWPSVRKTLQQTGWDLTKHLLVVDEWRVIGESKRKSTAVPELLDVAAVSSPINLNQLLSREDLPRESFLNPDEPFTIEPELPLALQSHASISHLGKKDN